MYLIIESPEFHDLKILNENKIDRDKWKVKFKAVLQTMNEVNKNNRLYPQQILMESLNRDILPRVKRRGIVGELDHPTYIGNQNADMMRHTQVLYKYAAHVITELRVDGKYILGELETLNTPYGYTLAGLILDNIEVGFSLRAVGNLKQKGSYLEVTQPFKIKTWDCVSEPSHEEALIKEISENTTLFANRDISLNESQLIHESVENKICIGNMCASSLKDIIEMRLDYLVLNL